YFLELFGLKNKNGTFLVIGLDNAGKTTLLRRLKEGTMGTPVPTWYSSKYEFSFGGIYFTAFDVGGHEQVRKVWRTYFPAVDAIIFIVDASDHQRFSEARAELDSLLSDISIPADAPLLLLGNKIDRPTAASEEDLRRWLGVQHRTTGKQLAQAGAAAGIEFQSRPMELFMCSVLQQQGYGEAFRWLTSHMR
uniref:small monomeric GTPase n=1 Tax=Macrostomum lignano TaxID=282301 RepID=A0A1I8HGF0_9PLAT